MQVPIKIVKMETMDNKTAIMDDEGRLWVYNCYDGRWKRVVLPGKEVTKPLAAKRPPPI